MSRVSDGSTREATTGDAGRAAPVSPVDEALSLLTRAQNLADQLRADANREVSQARAEATRVRGETQEASHELEQLQATVLASREEAERRLEETRAEVEIMLADAADQASLLRARATKASDEAEEDWFHPLTDDQAQDVESLRAERHADADLAGSLLDCVGDRAIDPNRREEECDPGKNAE